MAPKKKTEEVGEKRQREDQEPTSEDKKEEINGKDDEHEPASKRQDVDEQPKEILEEGRIYFLYRPRVGLEEAHSLSDVQRFFIIMSPTSRKDAPNRLIPIGKKRLPDPAKRERFFGFVQATDNKMDTLMAGLEAKEYETKTRGTRRIEAARALGEGVYKIYDHGRDSRLAYELEVPQEPGDVQEDFRIKKTGSYIISVKNPEAANPPNAGLGKNQKADYPKDKKKEFDGAPGGYSWISAKDPSLLDFNGCELVLIATHADISGELDGKVEKALDEAVEHEVEEAEHFEGNDEDAKLLEKLRSELHAEKHDVPVEPAADGDWK
ncbi:hypothetical protein COCSUDRAFT_55496 [Coccomyxa subellipsoidea C-169]|uniref:Uncharacterized protein n=1 Tax=Coccomyxa subellipsoidea (strain C-169) TaxID=574566 RepID=I0ZA19_COCSC|nr:hypothetical protein COCSUDRAFT_55496 [Coccomyxa subellipsoidea C-169]EIE27488.1 hypothetical protein COCSUDRAFT_55496 [Coccomyxa subellipsoidea C-169]|eukprot:XP_005652032.1 hypothetical protein COCSUDRAFT_55496 [Coccomyxa subellipsoidea C-169]